MDTFKYVLTLADIKGRHPTSSWVRITTITMISKLGQDIDLDAFRAKFEPVRLRAKGSTAKGFEWTMKKTTFYNQVTIGYRDQYSQKSIKLFPNGSIQVAGCSDLFDCTRILRQVGFLVSKTLGVGVDVTALLANMSVKMINTNFSLNSQVNIKRVIERFKRDRRFEVTFNPERYPAVKLKFSPEPGMKQVTASLFSTGKVIVTGAQTLDEIASAYQVINGMFDDKSLYAEGRPAKPEKFDIFMGARFEEWVRVISEKNRV